jgi:hypothetical protein
MTAVDDASERTDFAGIQALSSRAAGYAVAKKCLEVQAEAERRDPSLRTNKRVVLHDDASSWYTGALGEIEVGRMISALGPEWFVRHAVPIGKGTKDVDHLVIGPGGVFAINTKHHSGATIWVGDRVLRVNNSNTRHLEQARSDGVDVSNRLAERVGFPVPVTSIIAVLNPHSVKDIRSVNDRPVGVLNARTLVATIKAQPNYLNPTKVELLKLAAEEPGTWHIDPHAADTLRVMPRFERLVQETGGSLVASPALARQPARVKTRAPRPRASRTAPASRNNAALVQLWGGVAVIIVSAFIFRGIANQPCDTQNPIGCMVPMVWLSLKPLVLLAILGSVGVGVVGTLRWAFRRSRL